MITALCLLLSAVLACTPAPGDTLKAKLILTEVARNNEANPGRLRTDAGQCRRFQAESFAAASEGYRLAGYPGAILHLPEAHADPAVSGRFLGVAWDMPGPETGNAFLEAARYDYDPRLSDKANREAAIAFLAQARAGDILQMVGTYSTGGRGTHTLLITRPYDPRLQTLYWADSNFSFRVVDGETLAVVRAYQQRAVDEVVGWLTANNGNGATLYRLRRDVVRE